MVFLCPSLALGEEVTWDDLVRTNGLMYKKFTDVPFTGKTTGQIQGSFKDGVADGPWVEYWDNGRLQSRIFYKNGKREGPWVVYQSDGTVWEEYTGTYKNDVKVD